MPPQSNRQTLLATLVQHYEDLVDYVRHRFASRTFARDVVHDLCVQLLERPDATTARQPLALLRRASLYRAIDRQRMEVRHAAGVPIDELPDVPCHHPGPEARLHFAQQLQALREAIDTLPPRCRQVFLLHRLHDVPQATVAQELGISRNMVARHMARAMGTLRPVLDRSAMGMPRQRAAGPEAAAEAPVISCDEQTA